MNTGMPSLIEWSVDSLGAATGEQAAETIQSICMLFRPPLGHGQTVETDWV